MSDGRNEGLLGELRQIRQLLELLAEPAIAKRDAKLRAELRAIVGNSRKKRDSVLLMNGTHTRTEIIAKASIDKKDISVLIGKLDKAGLLAGDKKQPNLAISVPPGFFDADE